MSIVELRVPVIGESINEVTLSTWLKSDGDFVKLDEPICEFESDKATLEFPAEAEGKLIYVAAEGDDLEIGAIVAKIDTSVTVGGEASAPSVAVEEIKQEVVTATKPIKISGKVKEMIVPVIGESITEVTLSTWLKGDGEYVELDEPICEFESDKATLEFPAEASGILRHIAAEGDDIAIGSLVAKIEPASAPQSAQIKDPEPQSVISTKEQVITANYATGHPSPAAAKILAEKGIASDTVSGTGKDGRITKQDAQSAQQPAKQAVVESGTPSESKGSNSSTFSRGSHREKMSRMRRTIASRLVAAKNDSAMLTTFNEVDLTNIMALRKKYQEKFVEKHGIKLGFMSLFTKACAKVLMEMPEVNAIIDGDHLIYHDYADISIAISTPTGLVVPPVHNCESLDFHEIELKIKELATKARNGKLTLDEMKGGTFSITNGGIFGSMMSTPILNKPQSAILGMHTIKQRPIVVDGEIKIRPMMYLAMSYDHRVIDGKSSVGFLVRVIELLEDPMKLMMNL